MPKATTPSSNREGRRHNPLYEELLSESGPNTKASRTKGEKRHRKNDDDFVDSGMSKKILKIARDQQDEITHEDTTAAPIFTNLPPRFDVMRDEEDSEPEEEYEEWNDVEEEVEEVEIDENDATLFEKFLPRSDSEMPEQRISLADKILEKIAEREAMMAGQPLPGQPEPMRFDPRVLEVYTRTGLLLSRHKSGKLPKPFKIIPTLQNWEEYLNMTRPDKWTPMVYYEATRLFAAQKAAQMQKFLERYLLERVRDEIDEHKKLNVHLYNAIKKSLYKPSAFFKGFLFPLVGSGTCTLKEAQIIGSVLTRISIPVVHSAVALSQLCKMEYSGPTSVFIKVLIDKKYALPYQSIDAVVEHFMQFKSHPEPLPLLWHKSFLAFAQRYKTSITEEQRDMLLDVLQVKGHDKVGSEIRRELLEGREKSVEESMAIDDDDLMLD